MIKLLIVEDDEDLLSIMQKALSGEGYSVNVAGTAGQAKQLMSEGQYDAIVLDWGLPDETGIDLCRQWRAKGIKSGILFLTARSRISCREAGLDAGADDYLIKPFQTKELIARLRALLRRSHRQLSDNVLKFGSLSLNASLRLLTNDDVPIQLAGREYSLLEFLMRNPDIVFSNEDLLKHVWTADENPSPEIVRTHIMNLRKKIDRPGRPSLIETVHAIGYRLSSSALTD